MNYYSIAGVTVGYEPIYELLRKRSEPYLCKESGKSDFNIVTTELKLKEKLPQFPLLTLPKLEYMFVGAEFYNELIRHNGFLLHASAVVVNGEAYAFSAPSGTGKSTHTSLWMEHFRDNGAFIINDDKPAIKLIDGRFYVYGTPFSGKSDLNVNVCVPLKAVSFIQRADTNSIYRMTPMQAVASVLQETIRPDDENTLSILLNNIEKFAMQIPAFSLSCNMSEAAAEQAYAAMSNAKN